MIECIHCGQATLSKFNANIKNIKYDAKIHTCAILKRHHCNLKTCISCAAGFVKVAKENVKKKFLSEVDYSDLCNTNKWFKNISSFVEHKKVVDFTGACCTIQDLKVSQRNKTPLLYEQMCNNTPSPYEGVLHLYQHNVLISPTLSGSCIDVHSFAADHTKGMKALLHGVMDQEQADRANLEYKTCPSFKPDGTGANKIHDETHNFIIQNYFSNKNKTKVCVCGMFRV
jgi:hypothetical protein